MSTTPPRGTQHGVVSLLDPGATMRVRETWAKLERELGLAGVLIMPYPHFSYQIAGGYDRAALEVSLSQLADETAPFEVRTKGLATFPGPWPVVYVAVKKESHLRALHERVWNRCLPHAQNTVPYYRPEAWTPHITLAHGDERNSVPLSTEQIRAVLDSLNPKEYRWTVSVENLALVWDEGSVQHPVRTFPLRGQ
jgi:2'-5' RNA ligase